MNTVTFKGNAESYWPSKEMVIKPKNNDYKPFKEIVPGLNPGDIFSFNLFDKVESGPYLVTKKPTENSIKYIELKEKEDAIGIDNVPEGGVKVMGTIEGFEAIA